MDKKHKTAITKLTEADFKRGRLTVREIKGLQARAISKEDYEAAAGYRDVLKAISSKKLKRDSDAIIY